MDLIPFLFFIALFFNIRASFKLALDWRGMLVTTRFVRDAYARLGELPSEERLEREPAAPVFLHLVPAYHEPDIAGTVGALVASRYPHERLVVVVITKEEEERNPHPGMAASTGELVRRLRETLPPYQQKRLFHVAMPGPGRKAHQLNWALRPEVLREMSQRFGSQCIVLSVDARTVPDGEPATPSGWEVTTHGGRRGTGIDAVEWAVRGAELGVGEILLNSMDADGTKAGFDLPMIRAVRAAVSIPVIASGGAGAVGDFAPAVQAGADAVLAASVFHFGELTIGQVKDSLRAADLVVR